MQRPGKMEITVGVFAVAGLLALVFLALQVSNYRESGETDKGYDVSAEFQDIGDLQVNAPVRVSGVTVGRVKAIDLDRKTFEADVTLRIEDRFDNLPTDTSAAIYTQGILGSQYVALQPGGATTVLKNGSRIDLTQPAVVLEKVIGQFLYNKAEGSK
jgi:phospholipid/cholesterol/gamma-HCH transport system substrate-binding protein